MNLQVTELKPTYYEEYIRKTAYFIGSTDVSQFRHVIVGTTHINGWLYKERKAFGFVRYRAVDNEIVAGEVACEGPSIFFSLANAIHRVATIDVLQKGSRFHINDSC
jgi:hypothetical protein